MATADDTNTDPQVAIDGPTVVENDDGTFSVRWRGRRIGCYQYKAHAQTLANALSRRDS